MAPDGGCEDKNTISGLDMAPTIGWYAEHQDHLMAHIRQLARFTGAIPTGGVIHGCPTRVGVDEHLPQDFAISIPGFLSAFPDTARSRSIARTVQGGPSLWFHKDSLTEGPRPTPNRDEALSDTAIIPSYIAYDRDPEGHLFADINLYAIPDADGITDEVRTIILAQGLLHEYAHSIAISLVYEEDYKLQLGSTTMDGPQVLETFATLTGGMDPMSHYSSVYRTDGGGYPSQDEDLNEWRVAVEEELVESIAAYLLGFVFCDREQRRMDPFEDRPAVRDFVEMFLAAHRVS